MSSYMYSKTHSLVTRCGPSRTTTCTFHYEADAAWGGILTQMSLRNQPRNQTPIRQNRCRTGGPGAATVERDDC